MGRVQLHTQLPTQPPTLSCIAIITLHYLHYLPLTPHTSLHTVLRLLTSTLPTSVSLPPPLSQTYMGAYIDNPNNSSIFEGLQASLSLVGIALFFLQVRGGGGGWVGEGGEASLLSLVGIALFFLQVRAGRGIQPIHRLSHCLLHPLQRAHPHPLLLSYFPCSAVVTLVLSCNSSTHMPPVPHTSNPILLPPLDCTPSSSCVCRRSAPTACPPLQPPHSHAPLPPVCADVPHQQRIRPLVGGPHPLGCYHHASHQHRDISGRCGACCT